MSAGNVYDFRVEPQDVDFTLRATITSMCNCVLNTAGVDAQRNGFVPGLSVADLLFNEGPASLDYLR